MSMKIIEEARMFTWMDEETGRIRARREPPVRECQHCGQQHLLDGYDIECDCGKLYNGLGQELVSLTGDGSEPYWED